MVWAGTRHPARDVMLRALLPNGLRMCHRRGTPAPWRARGSLSLMVTVTSLPFCLPRLPAPLANVPRRESPAAPGPTQSGCAQSIKQPVRHQPRAASTLRALRGAAPSRASVLSFGATSTIPTTRWALWPLPGPAPPYSALDPPSSSHGMYPLMPRVPDEPIKIPSRRDQRLPPSRLAGPLNQGRARDRQHG